MYDDLFQALFLKVDVSKALESLGFGGEGRFKELAVQCGVLMCSSFIE